MATTINRRWPRALTAVVAVALTAGCPTAHAETVLRPTVLAEVPLDVAAYT